MAPNKYPSQNQNDHNKSFLPLQPNNFRKPKRRLFNEHGGNLLENSSPIFSSPIINHEESKLLNISLNSVCESFDIPMKMIGRFLRPEEARTFVSCNICASRLNVLWTSMINMMAHLYTSTMIVQENSFDIPRMYPTVSPLVYVSPSIVLCKLSAKQLYKQVMETTFQLDQTLERLNEDKKSMTTFEETNHFLISQLVRYCVELERGSTLNQNMKTVLIKEREFISHFQKMIIKRLQFILSGLDFKSIGPKISNMDIFDFTCSIFDVSTQFDIELYSKPHTIEQATSSSRKIVKNQEELELSNSSDGSSKSAIITGAGNNQNNSNNNSGEDLMLVDDFPREKEAPLVVPPPPPPITHHAVLHNTTNHQIIGGGGGGGEKQVSELTTNNETCIEEERNLTPSSPPVNIPTCTLSQPKTTPILKTDTTSRFRDDISFSDDVSNFAQEDASLLMKNAASSITPIVKKSVNQNPRKSILKQSKTVQKRPSSPIVDGFDSEEEPLISVHTSSFSSLNNVIKENDVLNDSDSDDMSDDLSTFSDITRNLGIHPTKKQKL